MILEAVSGHVGNDWGLFLSQVQWLDIVTVMTFILGVFLGLKNGLSKVIPKFLEVIAAQAIAIEYYSRLANFLTTWVPAPVWTLEVATFAVISIAVIIIVRFASQILSLIATIEFKPVVNNVVGAILGGMQFVLFLGLISSFLILIPIPSIEQVFKSQTLTGPYLIQSSHKVNKLFTTWLPDILPEKLIPEKNPPAEKSTEKTTKKR